MAAAAAFMISAIVVVAVVVMVFAVKIQAGMQFTGCICFGNRSDVAIGTADNFDPGLLQGVYRTAADAAANQHIDLFSSQQAGKRSVAGFSGGKSFFADNGFIGNFVNGKSGRVAKVLENHIVCTSYCYFHNQNLSIKAPV